GRGQGTNAIRAAGGTARLYNCIVWNNRDANGAIESSQITGGTLVIDHCSIQAWSGIWGGAGNSGTWPRLADIDGPDSIAGNDDDDLRLLGGSPAIDAGTNSVPASLPATDLAGNPRFQDDPGTPDAGVGTAPIVDRGCYEFQGVTCYANCDGSTAA